MQNVLELKEGNSIKRADVRIVTSLKKTWVAICSRRCQIYFIKKDLKET